MKIRKTKILRKYVDPADVISVWTSLAEIKDFKTNFLAYAKQLDENKHMGLDD